MLNLDPVIQLHAAGQLDAAEHGYRDLIDQGREQGKESDVAYGNLALICLLDGRTEEAMQLLDKALVLNPNNAEFYLNKGLGYLQKGQYAAAYDSCRKAIALNPNYPEAYLNIGVACVHQNDLDAAAMAYQKAIELSPNYAQAHYNLGNVVRAQGRSDSAVQFYRRALELRPNYAEAWLNLGNSLGSNLQEAARCFERAAESNPNYAEAWLNLGNVLTTLGRLDDACSVLRNCINVRPDYPEGYNNLGVALKEFNRLDEATACFEKAIELNPAYAEAYLNLGLCLKEKRDLAEALACQQKAIELKPDYPEARLNLGMILSSLGRRDEAVTLCQQAVDLKTAIYGTDSLVRKLGRLLFELERIPIVYKNAEEINEHRYKFEASLDEALFLVANADPCFQGEELGILRDIMFRTVNFYLTYQQHNDRDIQVRYAKLATKILMTDLREFSELDKGRRSGGKIRLGIASEYLRNHNGAFWAYGWLSQLPASDYEFFSYSLNGVTDDVTSLFASLGTYRWLPFKQPNYINSLRQIKADNLDILLLPDVGMTASSKIISLTRLAPVQCVGWGHPITTGSEKIDYYLSCELMETEESDQCFSEQLVRLPNIGLYLEDPGSSIETAGRADFGIPEGKIVYASLQSLFKYLPQYDWVYPAIAKQLPDAFFVFAGSEVEHVTASFVARLQRCFEDNGLDFDRHVLMLPRLSYARFRQLLSVVDLCLDTIGWTGGLTTMNTLAMNCPVVTVPGKFMRGRHTSAMLEMIDVRELIAESLDGYVALAARLGLDAELRLSVVEKIKERKHKLFRDRQCVEYLDRFFKAVVLESRHDVIASDETRCPEIAAAASEASIVPDSNCKIAAESGRIALVGCSDTPSPALLSADLYNRGLEQHRQGRFEEAVSYYRQALEIDCANVQILNDLGIALFSCGQLDEALSKLSAALEYAPGTAATWLNVGVVYGAQNRLNEAVEAYSRAIDLCPDYADAHYNLGNIYRATGRLTDAISSYRRALELNPGSVNASLNLGNVMQELGRFQEAVDCYRSAIERNENCPELYLNLGAALNNLGDAEGTIASQTRALALRPNYGEAYNNIGLALSNQGKWPEAIANYEKALVLKPDSAETYLNLGVALQAQCRVEDAIAIYNKVLELAPANVLARNNLGAALQAVDKLDLAELEFRRAVELGPSFSDAYNNLGIVLQMKEEHDEAIACYQKALAITTGRLGSSPHVRRLGELLTELHRLPAVYREPGEIEAYRHKFTSILSEASAMVACHGQMFSASDRRVLRGLVFKINNFYLAYQQGNDRDLQVAYAKLVTDILSPELAPYLTMPETCHDRKKIRLGVASEYLKSHNGSFWAHGWLSNLPADDYEFFLYSLNGATDWYTERFAKLGTYRWLPFGQLNYLKSLEAIRQDNLDVLLFTDVGMSASSRIISLARLAPVQCVGWGHPVTTGSPNVDFYLSSDLMETDLADSHYSEQLVRLPNLGLFLEPPYASCQTLSRADFGIPADRVVYGSIQSLFKYLPQYDIIYPRIAKAHPEALFVFVGSTSQGVTDRFVQRLKQCFAAEGVNFARHVKILSRMPFERFMQLVPLLDVNLDSIGWTGGLTSMRSLALDCPLVTIAGEFMRGRHSSAMYEMIGFTELVAMSVDEYIALSTRLGMDQAYRAGVIGRIRESKAKLFYDSDCVEYLDRFLKQEVRDRRN